MGSVPKMIPRVTLNSGHQMPILGFGTAAFPFPKAGDSKQVIEAILCGIENGYRHFDTASLYQTEEALGEAIKEAIRLSLIKSRGELFITSKLWCSDAHQDLVIPAIRETLQNLQLDYLDLYLIHWPMSSKPGIRYFPIPAGDLLLMDFESVWASMEECQTLGLTKSIGVSNFSCKKLNQLMTTAKIPPAVNQVEMNPVHQQKMLRQLCKEKGIILTAYSPLGAKGTSWGSNSVMDNDLLKQIAKARGKTHAQVCLRWVYEQGVCLLVKSFTEGRIRENLDMFDWALSEEETDQISKIPQSRATGKVFLSAEGPFKSEEDLWDGDI